MKPFNIKEHLEHPEWKVVTREGKPVRILCTDLDDNDYPVVAVVGNFHVDKFTAEGLFHAGRETKYDLFFASEKHEGWVNVIRDMVHNEVYCGNMIYASKEEAERIANNATLATAKIEWEE